ncbi:hypothetical protein [Pseudomonas oryzihabitans]|uniref:hypothetical protein n=1 Tax=Pseudomonas oryzihabitans TaxID=47885 RepID=UPI00135D4290|nr:hypothetical protein [Pseudomonas oryzihabitans]MXS21624.1 hypothetical protein [Pseudomonas oryzihabitans]
MNDRTLHTLIAALRFWQLHEGQHPSPLVDVASNDGEVDPLSSKEIDDLIENHLNAGGAGQDSGLSVKREGFSSAASPLRKKIVTINRTVTMGRNGRPYAL